MSAPFPSAALRQSLSSAEWEACLEAWLTLAETTLRLSSLDLITILKDANTLSVFLTSFHEAVAKSGPHDNTLRTAKAIQLRKSCFKVGKRILLEVEHVSEALLNLDFLSCFCHVHIKNPSLPSLMSKLWTKQVAVLTPLAQQRKTMLTSALESRNQAQSTASLAQLAPVVHACAGFGTFMLTGSDFLDALVSAFSRADSGADQKALANFLFLGLVSLLRTEPQSTTLLTDHLYTLKTQADRPGHGTSILAVLVTNTPILSTLNQAVGSNAPDRLTKLLQSLHIYQTPSLAWKSEQTHKRKVVSSKGKEKQMDDAVHIHRISLVTQIQDLFPDLGSGFVLKLLDEYHDDVEQATAHLLDDSLPPHLASLDRTEQAAIHDARPETEVDRLIPRSTPPLPDPFIPERRNVFDDDDFDRLALNTGRLHIGKANKSVPDASQNPSNKAAILSALAAFDSDDDERDDTYDVGDVGGTVDSAHPDGEPRDLPRINLHDVPSETDMTLYRAYKSAPSLFTRTAEIRRGQARTALKSETGMTDEAIEGWATMLQREPKRLRRLEAQEAMSFHGAQPELASTAYRESEGNTETEDSDAGAQPPGHRGGFRGRARGRGGRGRARGGGSGGNAAGPSDDPHTANAQRRKEANKGSRANHNRRDQRARKMARGGFPG